MLKDRKFRLPRLWSNQELRKFAPLFFGNIVNVSGWTDTDKENWHYKDYFQNATNYTITNYQSISHGIQGNPNEIVLDLEQELAPELNKKFDVVFNHTTLEHIYEIRKAFANLCLMTKDIVILVVPFLQPMHSDYGDYWRFTPLAVKKLFEENYMEVIYSSFNEQIGSSVYLFFIASKHPERWKNKINNQFSYQAKQNFFLDFSEKYAGCRSIKNNFLFRLTSLFIKK